MSRSEILEKINEIGIDVFENDDLEITEQTTAADVDEWDSLTHLSLINELENEYEIKFSMAEIQKSKNVGELIDAILAHLG